MYGVSYDSLRLYIDTVYYGSFRYRLSETFDVPPLLLTLLHIVLGIAFTALLRALTVRK